MRWACFALLVLALLGGFAYEYARRERSWDGAPEAEEEEERGLAEGAGNGWLDPWPWLWRHGTEEAAGPGFQRRRLRRRRRLQLLRTMTMEQGTHSDDEAKAVGPVAGSRRRAIAINATAATSATTSSKPWRELQLLDAAALRPFQAPVNFTTAGLRRAPPYAGLSDCFYTQQCFNVTTPGYGIVQRCKLGRICEECMGTPGRKNCTFVRVTGNPSGLGAQTSLSNVAIPSD